MLADTRPFIEPDTDLTIKDIVEAVLFECGHDHIDPIAHALADGLRLHAAFHRAGRGDGDPDHDQLCRMIASVEEELQRHLCGIWN